MKSSLLSFLSKFELTVRKFHQINESSLLNNVQPKVSIIIVVHDGLNYIKRCLSSIQKAEYNNFEIVIVNNNSNLETCNFLNSQFNKGKIHKLINLKQNVFFCKGNNIGVKASSKLSEYLLLLNSDTEIKSKNWLKVLTSLVTRGGIISYGYASLPLRPDGWCYLIDKKLYLELGGLKQTYRMNWCISEITRIALIKRINIKIILNYSKYIFHYGGKSYSSITTFQDYNKPNIFRLIISTNWLKIKLLKLTKHD